MSLTVAQKAEILARADAGERACVIIRAMGLTKPQVYRALKNAGRVTTFKARVIALHKADPALNAAEIAARIGCSRSTVNYIKAGTRLPIPRVPAPPRPRLMVKRGTARELGRAARAAGLTLAAIAEIAAQRGKSAQP